VAWLTGWEVAMAGNRWLLILAFFAAAVVGGGAIIVSVEANRITSTDAFCTSCHSMATLAAASGFKQSTHRSNAAGVIASCGDCHIPRTNWWVETYTHVVRGLKDTISENTHNFSDPKVWEAHRIELTQVVREEMRSQDSVTCRSCHDPQAIRPESERGQAAHALLREARMTCIDCHFNLHTPVPPRIGGPKK
jgi:nitrate/TMAO reductase-like tetraheme cytochrome c subunit